jgi:uncharacterized phage protein (TIGR02216 family)
MNDATPWAEMLSASLRAGLAPRAFWRLSVKEWRAAAGLRAASPLRRSDFDALFARFPDKRR